MISMGQGADGDGCGSDPVLLGVAIPKSNVYIGVQRKNKKNCHCPNSCGSTCIKS